MEPVEQFDEALGDSMTPQSEKTPREGERGDDSQESSSPSSESSSSASPPAESTRSASHARSGQAISKAKKRKTRKMLIRQYKALSAVLPSCSKKRDKACIMEECLAYLKQLQERVNTLEEEANNTSAVFGPQTCEEAAIIKLDAIAEGKNVLIRIECVKQKGCITKIVTEIEKLHLTIGSFNSLPFGNNLLAITISAQMDDEFYMTTTDLLTNLRRCMCEK
ncbi:Transcription factor like [Actinidia chinensis var. chinensis]|uniref:Transcription factor like n=1 Tax=Actinidia chinensis var. chinensis TaxID=1590841 RepID=A0A2R6P2Y3_ACTCC|nr:Transcription factor like [Actinidia chinensis var. chinensis]